MEEKENPQGQLDTIYDKLETGDISITDALKQSNILTGKIATEQTVDMFNQQTREALFEKDVQAAEKQWHKDYPDYQEFVESGQAQEYMARNPMIIDEPIAYFQWKADKRVETGKSESKTKEPAGAGKKFLNQDEIEGEQMRTVLSMKDKRPARKESFASEEEKVFSLPQPKQKKKLPK
jgi:hypothetical protein